LERSMHPLRDVDKPVTGSLSAASFERPDIGRSDASGVPATAAQPRREPLREHAMERSASLLGRAAEERQIDRDEPIQR